MRIMAFGPCDDFVQANPSMLIGFGKTVLPYGVLPNLLPITFFCCVLADPGDAEGKRAVTLSATDPDGRPCCKPESSEFFMDNDLYSPGIFRYAIALILRKPGAHAVTISIEGGPSSTWPLLVEYEERKS